LLADKDTIFLGNKHRVWWLFSIFVVELPLQN